MAVCSVNPFPEYIASSNQSEGQARGLMLLGLAYAVLSRSQGATDYTIPANLKAGAQALSQQPEYGLYTMDATIALNEITAQQNAGGMVVTFPDPVTAAAVAQTINLNMSPAELSAAETLLRCLLTQ